MTPIEGEDTDQTLTNNTSEQTLPHKSWWPLWLLGSLLVLLLVMIAILRGLCSDVWYINILRLNDKLCNSTSSVQQNIQLKDGSIRGPEIASGAVTINNLAPNLQSTIHNIDNIHNTINNQLANPTPGPQGATGVAGVQGATGAVGTQGPVGVTIAQNGAFLSGSTLELGTSPLIHDTVLPQNGYNLTLDASGAGGGNLIALGTRGAGIDLAVSGAGTRSFWYPKKSAWRAGTVTGAQWDDANIGDYSIASGKNTVASGELAVAFGDGTTANGYSSTAFGSNTTANGNYSTAFGNGIIVDSTATNSVGIGLSGSSYVVTQPNSLVVMGGNVGIGTTTPVARLHVDGNITVPGLGISSERFGLSATANGARGLAVGTNARANGDGALAVGYGTSALMPGSIVFGDSASSSLPPLPAIDAIAIGRGAWVGGSQQVVIGTGNNPRGTTGSVLIGTSNVITGSNHQNAILIGANNSTSGTGSNWSTVIGTNSTAGNYGITLGVNNDNSGLYSMVMGRDNIQTSRDSINIGNNIQRLNGWDPTYIFGGNTTIDGSRASVLSLGAYNSLVSGTSINSQNIIVGYQNNVDITSSNHAGRAMIFGTENSITINSTQGRAMAIGTGITNNLNNSIQIGLTDPSKMTIDLSGVDIGGATAPTNRLTVTSNTTSAARFNGSGGTQCTVVTGTGWSCSSDESLKTNILNINVVGSLAKLGAINPITYQWKGDYDDWVAGGSIPGEEPPIQYGFTAQDVEQYLPEVVQTDAITGLKTINYGYLNTFMIVALKENYSTIEAFKAAFDLTVPGAVTINSDINANAGLNVAGTAAFNGTAIFNNASVHNGLATHNGTVNFIGSANFDGAVNINGRMQMGSNNTGMATVIAGGTNVYIPFPSTFSATPNVQITPTAPITDNYWVSGISSAGFTINLNSVQGANATFNWQAF